MNCELLKKRKFYLCAHIEVNGSKIEPLTVGLPFGHQRELASLWRLIVPIFFTF